MLSQLNKIVSSNQTLNVFLKKYKNIIICVFIFSFTINFLTLSTSIYSLQILDRVLSSGSIETLLWLSVITIICIICLSALSMIRSFVFLNLSKELDKEHSTNLFEISISQSSSQKTAIGSQLLRDFSVIKSFLTGSTMSLIFDLPWVSIYIIAIFFIHYISGIITVVAASILFLLAFLNEKSTKNEFGMANEANIKNLSYVETVSKNAEVVEAMGMKKHVLKSWENINEKSLKLNFDAINKSNLISSFSKFFRLFIQILLMGVGTYLSLKHEMSSGGIIAISILAGKALAPFDAIIETWKNVLNVRKSYSRLTEEMNKFPEKNKPLPLPEPMGYITVDKLFFNIPKTQRTIIKGLNFEIKPGEIIGIIGPSASGKTTLAKLLVGIWKSSSGIIRIDNADISLMDRELIGAYIGYVPQDIELFSGSVKENIARMNSEANPEDILKAAKLANAHNMILQMPNGYETEIGINGSYLSAGQRQRLALARAFYGNPKFLVLDEPNSNLDIEGDNALLDAINHARNNNITTILITHKTNILNQTDKIIVLHDGAIKAFKTKDEILNAK